MSESPRMRAVIWDLGGVIVRTMDYATRIELAQRVGMTREELERAVFECELSHRASIGEITSDELWEGVCDELNLSREQKAAAERAFWGGDVVDHELLDFIRSLRLKYKTALLSNAWSDLRQLLTETWKIHDAFDEIIISAEVGLIKPDPRVFELALKRLGIAPGEAVFIDDLQRNVEGARAVGLHAIRFRDPQQARRELTELLEAYHRAEA